MKTWLVYLLATGLSGSMWIGIFAVAVVWLGGTGFWLGRLPDLTGPLKRWNRIRRLREDLGMNPRNVNAATALGGLLANRNPAEAKRVLTDVVERCPDLPLPMVHLGQAQLASGETEAGRATLERALQLKPDIGFGEPLVRLGEHYLRIGNTTEAVAALTRATRVHGSYAEAWYKLEKATRAAGDAAGAKVAWDTCLSTTQFSPGFKARIDRPWRVLAWLALRFG